MSSIQVRNPEELANVYSRLAVEKGGTKKLKRGGCDLRQLDEAGTTFELVITYSYKPGRFSKEKTIIAVVPIKKLANGVYSGNIGETTFRILAFKKGNFEEEWSGNLEEAREKIPEVASAFEEDIEDLKRRIG